MSNEIESKSKDLYSKFREVIQMKMNELQQNEYSFSQNHLFL